MQAQEITDFDAAIRELQSNLSELLHNLYLLREQEISPSPEVEALCVNIESLVKNAIVAIYLPDHLVATRH